MSGMGPWVVERRDDVPGHVAVAATLMAVLAAFAVGGVIFWAYGIPPLEAYRLIVAGTLGDVGGVAQVVRRATPLVLVGAGLVLAFRARFWNIGAEGQLLAGAFAAGGVALFVPLPAPWLLPASALAAGGAGAVWGLVPTQLRLRLGVNEVISTLMMNYIAIYIGEWLVHGPWKGKAVWGFPYSDTFPEAAWMPVLPGTQVHWPTLATGLALAGLAAVILTRTRLGHEIRVVGDNPDAARYAGIDARPTTLWVMGLSGAAAGLAGFGEVTGIHHRLLGPTQISLGYGYTGVIVALLARGNPLAAVLSALLMGWIFASGDVMKVALRLPFQAVNVLDGLILLFVAASEPLMRYRIRRGLQEPTWTERPSGSSTP